MRQIAKCYEVLAAQLRQPGDAAVHASPQHGHEQSRALDNKAGSEQTPVEARLGLVRRDGHLLRDAAALLRHRRRAARSAHLQLCVHPRCCLRTIVCAYA